MVTKGSYDDYTVVYHLEGPADMSSFIYNAHLEAVEECNKAIDEYQAKFEALCAKHGIKLPISSNANPKKFAKYLALWRTFREENEYPADEYSRMLPKCEEVGIVKISVEEVYFD